MRCRWVKISSAGTPGGRIQALSIKHIIFIVVFLIFDATMLRGLTYRKQNRIKTCKTGYRSIIYINQILHSGVNPKPLMTQSTYVNLLNKSRMNKELSLKQRQCQGYTAKYLVVLSYFTSIKAGQVCFFQSLYIRSKSYIIHTMVILD